MSQSNRLWMYDRMYPNRGGIKPAFYAGLEDFLLKASETREFRSHQTVKCPCAKCVCRFFYDFDTIRVHLCKKGFMENYWVWKYHGEVDNSDYQWVDNNNNEICFGSSSGGGEDTHQNVDAGRYEEMIHDAYGVQFDRNEGVDRESPNAEAARFFALLEAANKPLWEGSVHSELSLAVRMLSIKSEGNQSQSSFDQWATLIRELSPNESSIPKDFYEANKLVSKLGLKSEKIDCCKNGCMLYYKDDAELTECKFFQSHRYKPRKVGGRGSKKPIPHKRMHYLPIIPRLKRLFASMSSAPHMRWHYENKRSDGVMTHPSHGEAWLHFDNVHPTFAADPRSVRLGLCSDGFTPNREFSHTYSCWPVILTPYNLPPEMCMKDPYMFLTCIIPGPTNPKANIDVYLQPLIDELKELWVDGVLAYDVVSRENFMLRAALMWTINDFPAYGMLSGWMTQGKLACPVCMEDTKAFTLKKGGKNSWFDCHRRFLDRRHPFRNNRESFRKNKTDHDEPPHRLSGLEVYNRVKNLPKITELGKSVKFSGYGVQHNWTKQSIFWELPYWKDNLVRHCIDVMHVEKNVCDNILNTVMDTDKTKDNVKARYDLKEFCGRSSELHVYKDGGHLVKPKAAYSLNARQKEDVCQWIRELRMPDGYASNLSRCVNEARGHLVGMKSHDSHVFLQCLLPVAFHELPSTIWKPLTELSLFFKDLCSATLSVENLRTMEDNIPLILCKLEKIFPPGFFDSMEHLPVHLPYEARVCGPVQYRWMYPFERNIGVFKRTVKNRAHVEGSICEAYLSKETSFFCSYYFEPHVHSKRTTLGRNDDGGESSCPPTLSVFNRPGRGWGNTQEYFLTDREKHAAHLHVLINCEELESYKT